MKRQFLASLVFCALASLVAIPALAQNPTSAQRQALDPQINLLFNLSVKKVSLTSVSFAGKGGKALGSNSVALVDIGGTTFSLAGPLAITLPNQSVFGGTTNDLPVFIYAAGLSTGKVALCLSDADQLTTKGSVASGNTAFVSCPGVTVTSASKLRLLGRCVYDNATQLTSAACESLAEKNLNKWPS